MSGAHPPPPERSSRGGVELRGCGHSAPGGRLHRGCSLISGCARGQRSHWSAVTPSPADAAESGFRNVGVWATLSYDAGCWDSVVTTQACQVAKHFPRPFIHRR